MHYLEAIERFQPGSEQEAADKAAILEHCALLGERVLTRESRLAHISSSGLVLNPALDRLLFCHHNILGCWAWTGGHADGDSDLLAVALREAEEETGAVGVRALDGAVASLDVLPVPAHRKRGEYVGVHLHLSVAYLLVCPDDTPLAARPGENTAVRWFDDAELTAERFSAGDLRLYKKLLARARRL